MSLCCDADHARSAIPAKLERTLNAKTVFIELKSSTFHPASVEPANILSFWRKEQPSE